LFPLHGGERGASGLFVGFVSRRGGGVALQYVEIGARVRKDSAGFLRVRGEPFAQVRGDRHKPAGGGFGFVRAKLDMAARKFHVAPVEPHDFGGAQTGEGLQRDHWLEVILCGGEQAAQFGGRENGNRFAVADFDSLRAGDGVFTFGDVAARFGEFEKAAGGGAEIFHGARRGLPAVKPRLHVGGGDAGNVHLEGVGDLANGARGAFSGVSAVEIFRGLDDAITAKNFEGFGKFRGDKFK